MFNMIKADMYQLRKNFAVKMYFLISFASAILVAAALRMIELGKISNTVAPSISMLVDTMLIPLIGAIITGVVICRDFETKNIHDEINCGNGRFAILMSKVITCSVMSLIVTLPYAIVCAGGFISGIKVAPLNGIPSSFFNVLINSNGLETTLDNIGKAILVCALVMFMYVSKLSICIPIAFASRKNVIVIIAGFISAFLFDILAAGTEKIKGLHDFFNRLPYAQTLNVTMNADTKTLLIAFASGVAFLAVMVSITNGMFKKSEIK